MNSAASSPSKKPLAPLVAALAIEAVSIDSVVVATRALRESPRCSKRISGNQIGSFFFFAHVKMSHVALQRLQKKSGIGYVLSGLDDFAVA